MKKSLFSFLMVAMVATITFAFAPKDVFDSVDFRWNGTTWVIGEGVDCGGAGAYCQLTVVNDAHAQYISLIQAQVGSNHAAGSFSVTIDPVETPTDLPAFSVPVILTRKQ